MPVACSNAVDALWKVAVELDALEMRLRESVLPRSLLTFRYDFITPAGAPVLYECTGSLVLCSAGGVVLLCGLSRPIRDHLYNAMGGPYDEMERYQESRKVAMESSLESHCLLIPERTICVAVYLPYAQCILCPLHISPFIANLGQVSCHHG